MEKYSTTRLKKVGEQLIFPCLQIWNKQNTDILFEKAAFYPN